METNPSFGTEVEKGSQISVVISMGTFFEIGDYVGEDLEVIKKLLDEQTNINLRILYEYQKDETPGTILKQDGLSKGDRISPTQNLDLILTVAKELEIQIPNLNNIDIQDAKQQLENQGVKVKLESLDISHLTAFEITQINYGVVIKTDPMMGSTYVQKDDSVITIYYYDRNDIPEEKPEEQIPTEPEEGDQD